MQSPQPQGRDQPEEGAGERKEARKARGMAGGILPGWRGLKC